MMRKYGEAAVPPISLPASAGPRARILELARAEGFEQVRFAPARPLLEARAVALARRAEGRLDGMTWITDEWLLRATNPGAFLDGAGTVVLLALPYHGAEPAITTDTVA
ncbi:MAG: hypothetical protein ACRDG3_07145, partial [Tepidiformaceae bacterium]